jgi:hypothetical protein
VRTGSATGPPRGEQVSKSRNQLKFIWVKGGRDGLRHLEFLGLSPLSRVEGKYLVNLRKILPDSCRILRNIHF